MKTIKRELRRPPKTAKVNRTTAKNAAKSVYQRKTCHVLPAPKNHGWLVRANKDSKSSGHFSSKSAAINYARKISSRYHTDLVIHARDGRIQKSERHGK